jgi:hypothetical protein
MDGGDLLVHRLPSHLPAVVSMWHAIIGHSHSKPEVQRHAVGKMKPVLELNPLCRALLANRCHLVDPWRTGVGDGGNNGAGRVLVCLRLSHDMRVSVDFGRMTD